MVESIVGEEWRPVDGYAGYEVSNCGRVKSLLRREARILKSCPNTAGHLTVSLSAGGESRNFKVHTLVAAAFIGPRPPGMEVCHNDGTRENNCVGNLRYDTRSGNERDKVQHGTHSRGYQNGNSKLSLEEVQEMRRMLAAGVSHRDLSKKFGVSSCQVSRIRNGENWQHYPA